VEALPENSVGVQLRRLAGVSIHIRDRSKLRAEQLRTLNVQSSYGTCQLTPTHTR
jgi:hypothetical protein